MKLGVALALVSHELLHIQVDGVIIGLNAENSIVKDYLSSGILTFYI